MNCRGQLYAYKLYFQLKLLSFVCKGFKWSSVLQNNIKNINANLCRYDFNAENVGKENYENTFSKNHFSKNDVKFIFSYA